MHGLNFITNNNYVYIACSKHSDCRYVSVKLYFMGCLKKNFLLAGAPSHAINECVNYMIESNNIKLSVAKEYLMSHELHSLIPVEYSTILPHSTTSPSTLYFEEADSSISLNIVFKTLGDRPVHLKLVPNSAILTQADMHLISSLFGDRTYEWLTATFKILDSIELSTTRPGRKNRFLSKKLKIVSVLLNILVRRLVGMWPSRTRRLISKLVTGASKSGITSPTTRIDHPEINLYDSPTNQGFPVAHDNSSSSADTHLYDIGKPLIVALWHVFEYWVGQWVGHEPLAKSLISHALDVLQSLTESPSIIPFHKLMSTHTRRFQCSLLFLCDASTYDPLLLMPDTLALLERIGCELEWEQGIAHDLSPPRLARDLACWALEGLKADGGLERGAGVVNGFLFFVGESKLCNIMFDIFKVSADGEKIIEWIRGGRITEIQSNKLDELVVRVISNVDIHLIFRTEIVRFVKTVSRESHLRELIDRKEAAKVFDAECFLNVTKLYREYYGVKHLY
jgi:hypothetical protein